MQNTNVTCAVKICVSEFADDPDMEELIAMYVGSFPETVNRIKELLEKRCFVDLGRIAHQLKGSGGGYGFPLITDAAAQLEADIESLSTSNESHQLHIQKSVDELIGILEMARASATRMQK